MRAVIFDLWDTLVEWPLAEGARLRDRIADLVPLSGDEFEARWRETYRLSQTGPLVAAYLALGLPSEHLGEQVEARHAFGRESLRPRVGVTEVLAELRRREVKTAVLSTARRRCPRHGRQASSPGCSTRRRSRRNAG